MATGVFGGQCVENHTAMIFDRGGTRRLGPLLDMTKVVWDRRRDSISEANVRIDGDACSEQADFLASIRSHRHELVIFRGNDRVWEGPVHRAALHGSYAEIAAKDVLQYPLKTPMTQKYDNSFNGDGVTEVSTRIGDILAYELAHDRIEFIPDGPDAAALIAEWIAEGGTATPVTGGWDVLVEGWENLDPPVNILPHMVIHHFLDEARTGAVTLPFQMTVGEHLESLSRTSGIDYTAVGRAIHVWDVSRSIGRIGTWTEANFFSDVKITEYGADHAQSSYTVGQNGTYGSALNLRNLRYYGPWTTIFTAYNEEATSAPTQEELNSQSQRNLSGRSPVPIEVRIPDNSSIILTDTLTINQLVPGTQVLLRATLNARKMTQLQKIDSVKVTETAQKETVQVVLTPATRPDSDEVEP